MMGRGIHEDRVFLTGKTRDTLQGGPRDPTPH